MSGALEAVLLENAALRAEVAELKRQMAKLHGDVLVGLNETALAAFAAGARDARTPIGRGARVMISHRMHNLAVMLRMRPDLAFDISDRIDELAAEVARMEAAPVPLHMRVDLLRQAGVVSLDTRRKAVSA